jgi:hypothetical protein
MRPGSGNEKIKSDSILLKHFLQKFTYICILCYLFETLKSKFLIKSSLFILYSFLMENSLKFLEFLFIWNCRSNAPRILKTNDLLNKNVLKLHPKLLDNHMFTTSSSSMVFFFLFIKPLDFLQFFI